MKNPIFITKELNQNVEIGDPYILRFNGKYYLYCSTCDELEGIRCFVSKNLVDFEYYGVVAKDSLLSHAYAPEVIYYNGKFIMATSPGGNGHYFLESDSPLGPFKFITDNIANMIDGSFVIDKQNGLHFLRADHNGIAYLDVENNKLKNRKDILPQIGNAWTEGPSITYFNDYFYATYCGNDVLSSSYRVFVASSKKIDFDYRVQEEPLLLATENGFSGLGHNSIVLGPSLDEYYVAYHKLDWLSDHKTTRYLCLDRIYFNKRNAACNYSNFEVINPKRPDFECDVDLDNKFDLVGDKILSRMEASNKFTAEFNFKGITGVILGYQNENNYSLLEFNKNTISLSYIVNGACWKIFNKETKFDFDFFHSIRLINSSKCEVLIDNVSLFKINKFASGKFGYIFKPNNIFYTALTNSVYTNSLKDIPFVIPGKIEANYTNNGNFKIQEIEEEIDSILIKSNDEVSYKITANRCQAYRIYARMKNERCLVKLSSSENESVIEIVENEVEYEYSLRFLGQLNLLKNDTITLKVLDGHLEYQYLTIKAVEETNDIINLDDINQQKEKYCFTNNCRIQEIEFEALDVSNMLFGFIVNATNYSNWRSNKQMSYMGYFVGFDNELLVLDYCRYCRTRIYDKPYKLKTNEKYKMKVKVEDNMIYIYINDKLEIKTCLKYDQPYGFGGLYKSSNSNIKYISYRKE